MANKARTPMTTAEEIIQWAEKTREANGKAFTMLNKEEQLLMAKFILAMRDHIKKLQNTTGQQPVPPPQTTQEHSAPEPQKDAATEQEILERPPVVDKRQTNMEFFKANNVPMSRAYQLYCIWRNCDPDNRTVFDDERKAWLKAAGFAFWLNLPHE